MDFGLGLVLSFTNRASAGLSGVVTTLNGLQDSVSGSARNLTTLGNAMTSLTSLGAGLTTAITAPITAFLGTITQFGVGRASFIENTHLAFTSLMGDAQQASDYMQELLGFAKTTPYTYEGIASSAQMLISYGLENNRILQKTQDGYEGILRTLGDWAGSVGKGEAGFTAVADILGKINAEGRVSTIRLMQLQRQGLMASKIIGNMYGLAESEASEFIKTMSSTQFIDDLIKGLQEGTDGVNGITGSVEGLMSQLKNTWSGALDTFKSSMKTAGLNLMSSYTDEFGVTRYKFLENMTASLNNVSDTVKKVSTILQPLVDTLSSMMVNGSKALKKFGEAWDSLSIISEDGTKSLSNVQKRIGKVVSTLTLMGPALLIAGKVAGGLIKAFASIKTHIISLLPFLTSFGLALGLLAVTWKTDFAGMRTSLTRFVTGVITAFTNAKNALTGDVSAMTTSLKEFQKDDFFSGLTIAIMRVMTLSKALSEGWDDFTLSEDTFLKAKELGILPLIESIFDLKYRFDLFKEGFVTGWTEATESIKSVLSGIAEKVDGTIFETLLEKVIGFFDALTNNDPDAWKSLGEFIGDLSAKALLVGGAFAIVFGAVKKVIGIFNVFKAVFIFVKDIIVKAFTTVKGWVLKVAGWIGTAVTKISGFFTAISQSGLHGAMTQTFGTVATVITGIISIIAGAVMAVISFVDQWNNGFSWIKEIIMVVGIALVALGAIILGAPALITGVIAGIVAVLATLVVVIHEHWEEIKAFLSTLGDWIYTNVVEPVANFFVNMWNGLVDFLSPVIETVKQMWESLKETVSHVVDRIKEFFGQVADDAKSIWDNIMTYVTPAIDTFIEFKDTVAEFATFLGQKLSDFWTNTVVPVFSNVMTIIGDFLSNLWTSITNVCSQIWTVIKDVWDKIWGFLSPIILKIWDLILGTFTSIFDTIMNVLTGIWNVIVEIFNGIVTIVGSTLSGVWQSIANVLMGIMNLIMGKKEEAKQHFSDAWEAIKGIFSNVGGYFKGKFEEAWNKIKGVFSSVGSFFGGIWDTISEKFTSIGTAVGEAISGAFKSAINSVIQTIENTLNWIPDHVNPVLQTITDWTGVSLPYMDYVDLPRLAKGGVVSKSTIANIGEDGAEAVVPLERNTKWIGILAQQLEREMSSMISGRLKPVNTSNNTQSSNYNNSSTSYMTTNNGGNTYEGDTDNSVVFNAGAIQIHCQNASEEDAVRMAKKIMSYIKRQNEIDRMMHYAT